MTIKFTDGEGNEWTLQVEQSEEGRGGCHQIGHSRRPRACGYEPPLTVRDHIDLLQSLGYFVENPKAADSEIRALRSLERFARGMQPNTELRGILWCRRTELDALLKAIDEARK